MPTATRTFRIFVRLTFEDLKTERDALKHEEFPSLRRQCEENNKRFQTIGPLLGVLAVVHSLTRRRRPTGGPALEVTMATQKQEPGTPRADKLFDITSK